MKLVKRILVSLLILVAVLAGGVYAYLLYSKPVYSGNIDLPGLKQPVKVIYDKHGVPHIYAQNEEDLYYAFGYVHAQERLFQMELIRRVASGRLAEIFGKELLPADKFFRTLGLTAHAEASAETFNKQAKLANKVAAEAYLRGINEYLHNGKTPVEFTLAGIPKESYTTKDLFLVTGYMSFSFAMAFKTDPLYSRMEEKLGTDYTRDLITSYVPGDEKIPVEKTLRMRSKTINLAYSYSGIQQLLEKLPVPLFIGSNSWIVSPRKSASGKVIFANDTHIGYSQPAVWYEAHLECPGFSFYGNHLGGFPFAALGHTRTTTWGLTMFENDDIDFYREQVNPDNPDQVWAINHWEDMQKRSDTIRVKGEEDVLFEVKTTRHGPVINPAMDDVAKNEKDPVAFFWTYLKFPSSLLEVTYEMARAKNIEEFRNGPARIVAPGLNVMYGDAAGNIAWYAAAKQLKRAAHVNPVTILDGASGKDDPAGYYSFDENPKSENPPSGYVYSANNQPDIKNGKLWPGYYMIDDRAKQILSYLKEFKKFSADDFAAMQYDMVSPSGINNTESILQLISEEIQANGNANEKKALAVLSIWKGDHQLNDIAPAIYYGLLYQVMKQTFEDELGEADFNTLLHTFILRSSTETLLKNDSSLWWDNVNTSEKETRKEIFLRSFRGAVAALEKQLGKNVNDWQWSRVHTLEHPHPMGKKKPLNKFFNVGPFPAPAAYEVINQSGFHLNAEGLYPANSGPAMRTIIDFADVEHARSVLPTGQSGNPMSPFYKDQAKMYLRGEYRLMLMNQQEIEQSAYGTLIFRPSVSRTP